MSEGPEYPWDNKMDSEEPEVIGSCQEESEDSETIPVTSEISSYSLEDVQIIQNLFIGNCR